VLAEPAYKELRDELIEAVDQCLCSVVEMEILADEATDAEILPLDRDILHEEIDLLWDAADALMTLLQGHAGVKPN
jgi:hypothetical protein